MQKLELLAPAKDYNCAISAINCGADAIYIGANSYGARKNASNKIEDIEKIINYAHLFNVKVYVTLNTILNDNEIDDVIDLINKLYAIKTDALIIQDFAILNLAYYKKIPPIVLHASTQCNIRNIDKVKFFENTGLKRVILARELSIDDIKKIRKNTNIELECFIHGALCVSYSGNCYLSFYIGKRSANRGECAQVCRKKYDLIDEKGNLIAKQKYLLSLKDNNLSKHLDKLIEAGIKSFKIEGRLKDENYIKNTILFYHEKLKKYQRTSYGEIIPDYTPDPEKTFNRSFCDDYLFHKKDNIYNFITPKSLGKYLGEVIFSSDNSFIINTKEKINPQDGLCFIIDKELAGCLVNKTEVTKSGVKIYPNKKIKLKIKDKVYRNIDTAFNKTLENSKTKRKLNVYFSISENKIILEDDFSNRIEENLVFIEFARNRENQKNNFIKSLSKTANCPFEVKKIDFLQDNIPFIPVSKINDLRKKIFKKLEEKILKNYKVKKQKNITPCLFPSSENNDYRLNVSNKKAKEFYKLSDCEIKEECFENLKKPENKELMRCRHCLKRTFLGCDNPTKKLYLVDEKKVKYPLIFDCKNCEMAVFTP